jgi:hypothetical protein
MENLLKDLASRSYLYSLTPIGIGTKHVESMTSYVSRLINAHNLNSGVFFTKIIYPYLGKVDFPRDGFIPKKSCTFNNFHQKSTELVSALTDLTMINNLELHTLLDFSNFLGNYEVRSNKYWCPCCYQESNDNRSPVYDKLIWAFNDVEVCLEHNCRLICSCPSCNTAQFHISRNNIMGYCYKCGSWLGDSRYYSTDSIPFGYFHWQEWTINNIRELLLLTPNERSNVNRIWVSYKDNIKKNISSVIDNYKIKREHLFNIAKIPIRLYYNWEKGRQRASLSSLLKLCYVTNTPLKKFLFMDFELDIGLKQLPNFIYSNVLHKTQKKYDIDELRQEIMQIISDKVDPPPSLSQVSKSFGYKKTETLRAKLPNETNIIIKNYRDYIVEEKQKRREELSNVIIKLLNRDIYPSQKNIEKELGKTSYFWKDSNIKLLNEICQELGVVRKKGPHTKIEIK